MRRCGVVMLVCAVALAVQGPASAARSVDDLLERIADADDASYRAKQLVVSFGDNGSAALLDVRSSPSGRSVRTGSGNDVTKIWAGDSAGGELTQVGLRPEGVLAKYEVQVGAPDELLGVQLVPLTLIRRADDTMAERWWVHEKSGVVYKRELFDASGSLAGIATLIEMEWGAAGDISPDALVATTSSPADPPAADAPKALDGGYDLWRTYDIEVDGRPAQHWIYSDGLHALSVFRTKGALAVPDGFTRSEALWTGPGPGTWAWEGDGHSYLVVAEEPAIDTAALLEPFPKGGRSILERLGSVWSRLFRWIFDS